MIRIEIDRTADGRLKRLSARGHALSGGFGDDVVCAAASVLVRSAARALEANPGVSVAGGAGARGELVCEVVSVEPQLVEWLHGVTDSLVQGTRDLAAEHPAKVQLTVKVLEGEKAYGS